MAVLAAALAALVVGPLLVAAGARARSLLFLLDGFVLATVFGLVVFDIVPHAAESAGPTALVAAAVGLFMPLVLHDALGARQERFASLLFAATAAGLGAHALVDGIALAASREDAPALAIAVVLHRLPVGVAVWWIARPLYGWRRAVLLLGIEGLGAFAGYALAGSASTATMGPMLGVLQAAAGGAVLHVVFGHAQPLGDGRTSTTARLAATIGAVAGAVLVGVVTRHGHADASDHAHAHVADVAASERFVDLLLRAAPFVVVAVGLSAVLARAGLRRIPTVKPRGGRLSAALRGALAGLSLPSVEEVAPLRERGVLARTAPPPAQAAFLVAGQGAPLAAIVVGVGALGTTLSLARAAVLLVVALVVGALAGRAATIRVEPAPPRRGALVGPPPAPPVVVRPGLVLALLSAAEAVTPTILAAAAIGACLAPSVQTLAAGTSPAVLVVASALLAAPLQVGALAATMIAGALLAAGLPAGAALALCITGPVIGVRLLRALARRRGAARAALFGAIVVVCAIAAGLLWDRATTGGAAAPPAPHVIEQASLALIAALSLVALVRHGARAFVARAVMLPNLRLDERHAHAIGDDALHMHGPGCGHESVVHDDHVDYLVEGHLHHPHEDHCDDHGDGGRGRGGP